MTQGILFDIQHYAVHDGPGIRTIVFFKGCPMNCDWCCNPESKAFFPQLRYFDFRCKHCLSCVKACRSDAISFENETINRNFNLCTKCIEKPCIENCFYDAIQISGKMYSVIEVMDIVSKDIPFYDNSGGGVTFSGGEPFSQPEFLFELLKESKARKIHTAVETCGWCDIEDLKKSTGYIDLFLYDLKLMNDGQHKKFTGKSNEKIIENLKFLAASGREIIIRFPLIPGITDTEENIQSIADFMKSVQLKNICLEPYHTFGAGKYDELGMTYPLPELKNHSKQEIESVMKKFTDAGLSCELA